MAGYGGGQTVYRTFFYTPHFTAGVATFILWKKLYNPNSGAINNILNPILGTFSNAVQATPSPWLVALSWCSALLGAGILFKCLLKHLRAWLDADIGFVSLTLLVSIALLPVMVGYIWQQGTSFQTLYLALMACGMGSLACITSLRKPLEQTHKTKGMDHRVIIQIIWMVLHFAIIGLTAILFQLETMASDGLEAPMWLVDYYWAKPALMLMGLWGAIGSNNMLLYLAALTNIPQDLYEAAEIDGANTVDTFWNVTWPQLAPTTFFIFIMSLIYGLQGGMEMAKTMTEGGPAGATTTLSYFIYMEGFETGRLGYASAISWALFLLVFTVTMVNWKFGGKK
jgi:multiple sugar transport system permease protein